MIPNFQKTLMILMIRRFLMFQSYPMNHLIQMFLNYHLIRMYHRYR
jgi:hypothetical protein